MSGALDTLATELALAIEPLDSALSSPEAARDFLTELGWDLASAPQALLGIGSAVETLLTLAEESQEGTLADVGTLVDAIRAVYGGIDAISSAAGLPPGFGAEFPGQLVEYLVAEYLLNNHPKWAGILRLQGILQIEAVPAAGPRPAYTSKRVAFDELGAFFSDPVGYVAAAYDWGQTDFKGDALLDRAYALFEAWGVETRLSGRFAATLDQLANGAVVPADVHDLALEIAIFEEAAGDAKLEAGVALYILPETGADKPGLALLPYASGSFETAIELDEKLELVIDTGIELAGGVGITLRPAAGLAFASGLDGAPSAIEGSFSAGLRYGGDTPTVLLGSDTGSALTVSKAMLSGGSRFHTSKGANAFVELTLTEAALAIKAEEGDSDGFLAKILPEDGIRFDFDTTLGFSTDEGVYFRGSGGLSVKLPVHIALGPVSVDGMTLAIKIPTPSIDGFGLDIELGADIAADLSVLKASVENLGLRATLSFPDDGNGNAGPIDMSLSFKPPNGVGLAIDASVVRGGGYLYLDYDKGEYAGALELVFSGFIAVKAIGLINTRMPDGSEGFSLLIVVTAEFGSPIQLGFGFTLVGLGGLLGLNRTMNLEEMAEGVRTGAIESVMFPQDVIANAPRILSDMRRFFPPEEGSFLIGPMAKLGWGTPSLITASIGVVIEIPPGNIAILGVLKCALPDEEAALLVLQVKFIGALEVDKERLWFFASLYGSRVLFITLDGEMALLIAWGSEANFLLSVGGFHPRFTAPSLPFPVPRRVALTILDTSFARIRVEGYFAVTSNTVQFGARVEIYVGVEVFSLEGHIGFDALFQFSPFYFIIRFSASVSVKVFGAGVFSIRFRGELEGTSPWHVEGEGSISILFWDIDIPFSHTWGDSVDTVLPAIAVLPLVKAEIEKDAAWQALPPPGTSLSVSLREILAETALVLHPVGALRIVQRELPLDVDVALKGNQDISDISRLSLDVTADDLTVTRKLREPFARSQHFKQTNDQKLSSPGFENMVAGIEVSISGSDSRTSHAVKRTVRQELITIDTNYREHVRRFIGIVGIWFTQLLTGNATARSARSKVNKRLKDPFDARIATRAPGFVLAKLADNAPHAETVYPTQVEAMDAMAHAGAPAGTLHVIPAAEMRRAA